MGQHGDLPHYYHVMKAAKILGCSYLELEGRPDKFRLMQIAFTFDDAQTQGQRALKKNPEFKKLVKQEMEGG